jgi:hypothetical protein
MFDTETLAPRLLPSVAWSQFEPSGLLTDLLSGLDVGRLDTDDALETAAAWERLMAHTQAQQFRALARFASLQEGPDSDEFAADEVAPVLHLSRGTAGARLDLATRAVRERNNTCITNIAMHITMQRTISTTFGHRRHRGHLCFFSTKNMHTSHIVEASPLAFFTLRTDHDRLLADRCRVVTHSPLSVNSAPLFGL